MNLPIKAPNGQIGVNNNNLTKIQLQKHSTKQVTVNHLDNSSFKLIGINDLLKEPEPLEWLVDDYILQGTQVQIVGTSGTGKTFLAIDLACSIVTGRQWNSRNVKQGPVAYINAEGHTGFQHRLKGWSIKHKSLKDTPFCLSNGQTDLISNSDISILTKHLDKFAAENSGYIAMIFIDTLRRNMSGNEDDSRDLSLFMNNFEGLCRKYSATGFIIHHPGHNNTSRARGSSSQKAALDTSLLLKNSKTEISLVCDKLKDGGAKPAPVKYELETITIPWLDSKGNHITTCIPMYDKSAISGSQKLKPMPSMTEMAVDSLNKAFNKPLGNYALLKDWKSNFTDARFAKNPKSKKDTIEKAFARAKDELIDKDIVIENESGNYEFCKNIDPPWINLKKHLTTNHFKKPPKKPKI